jgi:hypothetical protein
MNSASGVHVISARSMYDIVGMNNKHTGTEGKCLHFLSHAVLLLVKVYQHYNTRFLCHFFVVVGGGDISRAANCLSHFSG